MTELVVVRHGRTEANATGLLLGRGAPVGEPANSSSSTWLKSVCTPVRGGTFVTCTSLVNLGSASGSTSNRARFFWES